MTAKSRTGFITTYTGCPITWASKIQRDAALSSTESEYIAMSEAFRVLLPMMDLMEESRANGVPMRSGAPVVWCKAFKDNSGTFARLWQKVRIDLLGRNRTSVVKRKRVHTLFWYF
jgi:hypothetical protein